MRSTVWAKHPVKISAQSDEIHSSWNFHPKHNDIFFQLDIFDCNFCSIKSVLWSTMLAKHPVNISAISDEIYWSWNFQPKHNDIFLKFDVLGSSFCLINSLFWSTMLAKHSVKISAKSGWKWSNGKHLPAVYPLSSLLLANKPGLYTVP